MILNNFETCSICGYQIPVSEQAFVFKGDIVCLECDKVLRGNINTTEDIQITKYENKDINMEKRENETKDDIEINSSARVNNKLEAFKKINISDLGHDNILFKETETEADYINFSDDLIDANSQTNSQQVKIQLPPIIHSFFMNRNSSSIEPQLTKKHRAIGGFVIVICIVAIIAIGALLATRYLFK